MIAQHEAQPGDPGVGTRGLTIRWARFYDPVVALVTLGRARALRAQTAELAGIAPGARVLDVGCGTGDLTLRAATLAGPAGRVCGIDPSPEMLAAARRKAAKAGAAIDYRVAAIEALPFPAAAFDVVLSSLMLHHLPDDLRPRGLAEVRRVLKPGGRLLVVDFLPPTDRHRRFAPAMLFHRHRRGVRDLPALVRAAGFTAVESGPTVFRPVGFVRGQAGGRARAPGGRRGRGAGAPPPAPDAGGGAQTGTERRTTTHDPAGGRACFAVCAAPCSSPVGVEPPEEEHRWLLPTLWATLTIGSAYARG